jgi:hypothetical protein
VATLRSYGMDLLRWFRFLWAVGVWWDRATRLEARDFSRLVLVAGKPARPHWRNPGQTLEPSSSGEAYAPSVRAHSDDGAAGLLRPGCGHRAAGEPVTAGPVSPGWTGDWFSLLLADAGEPVERWWDLTRHLLGAVGWRGQDGSAVGGWSPTAEVLQVMAGGDVPWQCHRLQPALTAAARAAVLA